MYPGTDSPETMATVLRPPSAPGQVALADIQEDIESLEAQQSAGAVRASSGAAPAPDDDDRAVGAPRAARPSSGAAPGELAAREDGSDGGGDGSGPAGGGAAQLQSARSMKAQVGRPARRSTPRDSSRPACKAQACARAAAQRASCMIQPTIAPPASPPPPSNPAPTSVPLNTAPAAAAQQAAQRRRRSHSSQRRHHRGRGHTHRGPGGDGRR